MESGHWYGVPWGEAIAQAPCLASPVSVGCCQEETIDDPLKKKNLKGSVLSRFMENTMAECASGQQYVWACAGAGSRALGYSANLCLAGTKRWRWMEMVVAGWRRH